MVRSVRVLRVQRAAGVRPGQLRFEVGNVFLFLAPSFVKTNPAGPRYTIRPTPIKNAAAVCVSVQIEKKYNKRRSFSKKMRLDLPLIGH